MRSTLAAVTILASTALASTTQPTSSAHDRTEPPNIIFILCDDLGYGDLGVLYQNGLPGTKKLYTPELDQLAAEGLILDRHYCPGMEPTSVVSAPPPSMRRAVCG